LLARSSSCSSCVCVVDSTIVDGNGSSNRACYRLPALPALSFHIKNKYRAFPNIDPFLRIESSCSTTKCWGPHLIQKCHREAAHPGDEVLLCRLPKDGGVWRGEWDEAQESEKGRGLTKCHEIFKCRVWGQGRAFWFASASTASAAREGRPAWPRSKAPTIIRSVPISTKHCL
jgi:hypothetical protein